VPTAESIAAARRRLGGADGRWLAIHPGSGSPAKNWPADRFADVARELHRRGASILLIEGPAEAAAAKGFREAAGDLSFMELSNAPLPVVAAALAQCAALATSDSGVGHLAASVGTAVVAVFGPSRPEHWRPYGQNTRVLRARDGRLDSVSVGAVVAALDRLMIG